MLGAVLADPRPPFARLGRWRSGLAALEGVARARFRRALGGPSPLLDGKPVVLVTVRGGAYGAGTPRAGWDHSTPYLCRVLADVWGADLTVVEREFTLVGVNPALDEFAGLAAVGHAEALDAAHATGGRLAGTLVTAGR